MLLFQELGCLVYGLVPLPPGCEFLGLSFMLCEIEPIVCPGAFYADNIK